MDSPLFEKAVKVKADGVVSAHDWCVLKMLVRVQGPGGNGGTGGNGDEAGQGKDPFNTGLIEWGTWADHTPKYTLRSLRGVESGLTTWINVTNDSARNSMWHTSGQRVEQVFMEHATPLLGKVREAVRSLETAINTEDEDKVWREVLPVWYRARLFDYAIFQAWNEGWLSGDLATLMDSGSLVGGATQAYDNQMAMFRATRDAYEASEKADRELVAGSDRYIAWAEANLSDTLHKVEDHLVAWLNAAVEGEKALIVEGDKFRALAESSDERVVHAIQVHGWFRILEVGGDPRDWGFVAPQMILAHLADTRFTYTGDSVAWFKNMGELSADPQEWGY